MATLLVPARTPSVSPHMLSQARAAYVERIDAAADRAMRDAAIVGAPYKLIQAACYLAANGVAAPSCKGETFFGWNLAECRRYLDGLDPTAREQEIEDGYRHLFTGRRAILPAPALQVAA